MSPPSSPPRPVFPTSSRHYKAAKRIHERLGVWPWEIFHGFSSPHSASPVAPRPELCPPADGWSVQTLENLSSLAERMDSNGATPRRQIPQGRADDKLARAARISEALADAIDTRVKKQTKMTGKGTTAVTRAPKQPYLANRDISAVLAKHTKNTSKRQKTSRSTTQQDEEEEEDEEEEGYEEEEGEEPYGNSALMKLATQATRTAPLDPLTGSISINNSNTDVIASIGSGVQNRATSSPPSVQRFSLDESSFRDNDLPSRRRQSSGSFLSTVSQSPPRSNKRRRLDRPRSQHFFSRGGFGSNSHMDIEGTNTRPMDSHHEHAELDSQPELLLQPEDPHLSLDKEELSAVFEATAVLRKQSDRFYKMGADLEAEIAGQQERNAILEKTKSQAEKALDEATTQLNTLEENCVTAGAEARQAKDALAKLQSCIDHITDASVTNNLKKTIDEQNASTESKQAKADAIGANLSSARSQIAQYRAKQAAALEDYNEGLKRTEALMSKLKVTTDKKKQWGLVASTIRVGPLNLWNILFQHPDVTETLQDTEKELRLRGMSIIEGSDG